ncbi:hypothetical protein MTP99_004143 [Tenebrio molitor]|nr:hypothetical protein MTP99_004143 [Tenebrio molitor]
MYRLLLVVVIWRESKKMNVDGVDSDSEIDEAMTDTPPDIADEASAEKQDLLPKKSGDLTKNSYYKKNSEGSKIFLS